MTWRDVIKYQDDSRAKILAPENECSWYLLCKLPNMLEMHMKVLGKMATWKWLKMGGEQ